MLAVATSFPGGPMERLRAWFGSSPWPMVILLFGVVVAACVLADYSLLSRGDRSRPESTRPTTPRG